MGPDEWGGQVSGLGEAEPVEFGRGRVSHVGCGMVGA